MATRSTRSTTARATTSATSGVVDMSTVPSALPQLDRGGGKGRARTGMKAQPVAREQHLSRTLRSEPEDEGDDSSLSSLSSSPRPPPSRSRSKRTKLSTGREIAQSQTDEPTSSKPKRAVRKPKIDPTSLEGVEEDVVDTSGFLPRPQEGSEQNGWKVGAHVSAAGGVENAPVNAAEIGCSAFALFLKSQRKWTSPPLSPRSIALFKHRMKQLNFNPETDVLVHGNYLVNLGNPDTTKRKVSYDCFLDEIRRCGELGVRLLNIHPGSTVSLTTPENSCALIAECINEAHRETAGSVGGDVVVVLENMAGSGNIIGSTFEEISLIISGVEDKSRVGVCFDTCHGFSAGYDVRTSEGWDETMRKFDEVIGLKYLKGMHLNDSKTEFASKKDRHESIGMGSLGFTSFHHILNDPRTKGIPLVLETPSWEQPKEVWGTEIGVLRRLIGLPLPKGEEGLSMKDGGVEDIHEEKDALERLRDEVKAAITKVGGDQPKPKKAKAVEGGRVKGKGSKAKKPVVGEKRKRATQAEKDESERADEDDDDDDDDDVEGEGRERGCCKH